MKAVEWRVFLRRARGNGFLRNSMILFVGGMAANILGYFFHLVIGRMVSIEIYGEVESLVSFMSIISVPAMAITMIATKYAACSKAENNPTASREVLVYLNRKITLYGLPVLFLALLLTPSIRRFLHLESALPLVLAWVAMWGSFYFAVAGGILTGWQKFKASSFSSACGVGAKLFFAILLIKLGFALNGIMGSFLLGALVSYAVSLFALKGILKKNRLPEKTGCRVEIFSSALLKKDILPVFAGNLAITLFGYVDMFLAKHNLDPVSAGQYGALAIVGKIIFFATGVIATVLFSMAAESNHKKDNTWKIFQHAAFLMLLVSLAGVTFYFLFPSFALGLLFQDKYTSVSPLLGWFAILAAAFSFVNLIFQYLLSIQKVRPVLWLSGIALLLPPALLFFGNSISAILGITLAFQSLVVFLGLGYLVKQAK